MLEGSESDNCLHRQETLWSNYVTSSDVKIDVIKSGRLTTTLFERQLSFMQVKQAEKCHYLKKFLHLTFQNGLKNNDVQMAI